MYDSSSPHASTRPVHAETTPRTGNGLAVLAGFAALFPLTLFVVAHPAVTAATATGVGVGLLVRPLRRKLARRPDRPRPSGTERPPDGFGPDATRE